MSLQIHGLAPSRADIGLTIPDNWSEPILVQNLDALFIFNYLTPGFDALLQFGDAYGHEFEVNLRRVQAGVNTWDDRVRFNHGSFRMRARVAGNNPVIDYEADGLPTGRY